MRPFSFPGFEIQRVVQGEHVLTITAHATSRTATCQQVSKHVPSYYTPSPQDLPVSGRKVQLVLGVRRFRCQNRQCRRQTFAQPFPDLAVSARQTRPLEAILQRIAVVLSGQVGSRLAEQLAMPISATSLVRRAKKETLPSRPTPRVLGGDDFAFRRGRSYGTLLLDGATHQPVALLEDRRAETFAEWLRQHPAVELISRDRSKPYQKGATEGAPQAQQPIDRWHLLKKLREAIERFLSHTRIPTGAREEKRLTISPRQKRSSGERVRAEGSRQRRLALYNQVVELHRQGGTIQGIARQLQIHRHTVRKFIQAPSFPQYQRVPRTRSAIDAYRPYLQERWQAGCRSSEQLWRELQQKGLTGSWKMVYRWVQVQMDAELQRAEPTQGHRPTTAQSMAPRHLAWVFLHDPEQLDKQEQLTLSLLCQDKRVAQVYAFCQQFVAMLKERNPRGLDAWLTGSQMSGIAELRTFAQGLETEASALRAALTLPHSNGPVEGKINKLKYIKRSMYGRSGFPLLRQKVLKAA